MSGTRWARIAFTLLAWLFAAGVVIQVYLAGQAVFATGDFEIHRNWGYLFGVVSLVLVVLALAGRMPRLVVLGSLLLLVLMALQSVLVIIRADQPNIAALHPVNGMAIVLLGLWIAWRSLRLIRAPIPVDAEAQAIAKRQAELAALPPPRDAEDA
jgi:hypothetical protein